MVTMLRPGQEMLYKNQRGLIQKRIKMKLPFLSTALKVIARNMHTKFGAIWTYGDKVTLRTINARYKNQSKGTNSKTEHGEVTVLVHCTLSHCHLPETCTPSLESFGSTVTGLRSGQENPDDAADDSATADKSNAYKAICHLVRRHKNSLIQNLRTPVNPEQERTTQVASPPVLHHRVTEERAHL